MARLPAHPPRHRGTDLPHRATEADIDPDRTKFKRTVRILRRRAADPAFPPEHQRDLANVIADITAKRNPPMAQHHRAAGEGTVVAITVTTHGCGALLLTRHEVDYVDLPRLNAQDALTHANAFLDAVNPPPDTMVDTREITRVLGLGLPDRIAPLSASIRRAAAPRWTTLYRRARRPRRTAWEAVAKWSAS